MPPSLKPRSLILSSALAFANAFGQSQRIPSPLVRDSAGVRIVEHATIKTSLPAFRVSERFLADLGGLRNNLNDEIDPEQGYDAAIRFSDGRVAVAEMFAVRLLLADGRVDGVVGSRGGGPGQFNAQIEWLCRMRGDSFAVSSVDRRVTVFDRSGKYVRSSVAEGRVHGRCDLDGSLVVSKSVAAIRRDPGDASNIRDSVALMHLTSEGRLSGSIGVFPGMLRTSGRQLIQDRLTVQLRGDRLYVDNGSSLAVRVFSTTGKLVSIVRWNDRLTSVTGPVLRELAEHTVAAAVPARERAAQVARLVSMNQHATLPAYSEFIVDEAGRLWVRDFWPQPRDGIFNPGYTVFAADGSLLGRYELPKLNDVWTAKVTDVGIDYVVVRIRTRGEGIRVIVQGILPAR